MLPSTLYRSRCVQDPLPHQCMFRHTREENNQAYSVQVAVISTIPWDSYLIRTKIWSYPANVVVGPTLFQIPAEEIFFFVIQTYTTSLLYLFLSKPLLHPVYLQGLESGVDGKRLRLGRWVGNAVGVVLLVSGARMVVDQGKGLYMGLILLWAIPFVLLLWYVNFSVGD